VGLPLPNACKNVSGASLNGSARPPGSDCQNSGSFGSRSLTEGVGDDQTFDLTPVGHGL